MFYSYQVLTETTADNNFSSRGGVVVNVTSENDINLSDKSFTWIHLSHDASLLPLGN